jgi:(p)ppGpp synthase/HD superfamily hydrolase
MNLGIAIALAAEKFKNKTDKAGQPYILHCLRVMNKMNHNDFELMCIAVLHDVVEDTDVSISNLYEMGFSTRICQAVYVLTHSKGESYDTYIKCVATNSDAVKVKLADLKDNSDITRLKGLTKADFDRMEKYHRSFIYLSKI